MSVLARAVVVLGGDSSEMDKMLSAAESRMMKVGDRMQEIGKTLSTHVTLPIVALGALSVHAFGEQADAIARTTGVLKASGNVAGVTSEHMADLAKHLEETTTFADEVTQSAMAVLLAFQSVRNELGKGNDVFDRSVKVAQDLSELMGRDLQGAMLLVGKSMEDPLLGLTQLRRVGVIFDDQTIETIKNLKEEGHVLEAQKMILDGLEKRIGGLATVMADTPLGQFKQAWNEVNNAMEDVGKVLSEVLVPASVKIKEWAKAFQGLSGETKTVIVVVAGLAAAIGPLLIAVGTGIKIWTTLSAVLAGVALPVALAVAAFASLVLAGVAIAKHWTWLKQQVVALWAFIKDTFFTGVDAVLKATQMFLSGLGDLGTVMKGMPGPLGVFGTVLSALATPLDAAATGIQGMRDSLGEMAEASMAASGRTLARLENELMATGETAKKTAAVIKTVKPDPIPPAWLKGANAALKDFQAALREATANETLFGDKFDEVSAQADAYEKVVQALIAAGVPFDAKIGANGETLRELAEKYLGLRGAADAAQEKLDVFNATMDRAKSAVEAARTPQEEYTQTVYDLTVALAAGVITLAQYAAGLAHAQEALDETKKKTSDLQRVMQDLVKDGVSQFVDAVFDAKTNWSDFFRTMLADIAKLIIKTIILSALMKALKPGGAMSGIGGFLGFAKGGFLPPGQIGMVGERGPELVMAGSQGMRITPLPAMRASTPGEAGGGSSMRVEVNVNAIDSRGVADFFEQNEGLVAGAMMRAAQRSSAMGRRFG